jgi:tRNA pseudouridine55 synthase
MVGAGELTAAMAALTGDILQRPSSVSAVKVAGQRAHARVRAGEQVELPARPVRVTQFDLLALRPGPDDTVEADVVVRCGSGTYVRALARDVGEALGVGGCLSALRRTEAAGVPVAECRTVADFAADPQLVPVAQVIGHTLQVVAVPPASVVEFSHGRQAPDPRAAWTGDGTPREPVAGATGGVAREPVAGATGGSARVAVAGPTGEVAGVARAEGGMLLPDVVLVEPVMGATQ